MSVWLNIHFLSLIILLPFSTSNPEIFFDTKCSSSCYDQKFDLFLSSWKKFSYPQRLSNSIRVGSWVYVMCPPFQVQPQIGFQFQQHLARITTVSLLVDSRLAFTRCYLDQKRILSVSNFCFCGTYIWIYHIHVIFCRIYFIFFIFKFFMLLMLLLLLSNYLLCVPST